MSVAASRPFQAAICSLVILFALAANAATETILHSFSAQQRGAWPNNLVSDSSGNLFGTTENGGNANLGVVFEFASNAKGGFTETVLHSFAGGTTDGSTPVSLILDSQGNIYGVTRYGGAGTCNCGIIYELSKNTSGKWQEAVLYTFQSTGYPSEAIAIDGAGNLYFGTSTYTTTGFSYLYQLTNASGSWTANLLYTFSDGQVNNPEIGALTLDGSGNIYGTIEQTAAATQGLVFELSPASGGTWTEATLYTFLGGTSGGIPTGPLFLQNGNLYGTTLNGGESQCEPANSGCGVVYQLAPGNGQWTESVIYAFRGTDSDGAINPSLGGFGNNGALYGFTFKGGAGACAYCGSVLQLTPNGNGKWKKTTLWNFDNQDNVDYPTAVAVTPSGKVFGTSEFPGDSYTVQGAIFELTQESSPSGGWRLTIPFIFPFTDGQWPSPGLVADKAGNLYGSTEYGGTNDIGSIYEVSPVGKSWKESLLYSFGPASDVTYFSAGPSPLTFDSQGNLYGTTESGGANSQGSVFELSPKAGGGWQEKDLYSFNATSPVALGGVIFDRAGNIYFPTNAGGSHGFGAIFQLTQNANGVWQAKAIYSFKGYPTDGANPYGGLTIDAAGNLYGTTEDGGDGNCDQGRKTIGCGTVFELSYSASAGWTENILHVFEGVSDDDGAEPLGNLIWDAAGNLYGTTYMGGTGSNRNCPGDGGSPGCGTAFELSPSANGWSETILYEFTGGKTDGLKPQGGLAWDQAGNLYGSLDWGGDYAYGGLYKLSPTTGGGWTEKYLYSFGSTTSDGKFPVGSLILGPSGNFYGVTADGGVPGAPDNNGQGTVFEFTP
jgi:uncharacterized repeat protein (TIGR03803 family)